jgi:hypothetical protein
MRERLVTRVITVLDEQTVIVAGTTAAERILPGWPTASAESCCSVTRSPVSSKRYSIRTLLPGGTSPRPSGPVRPRRRGSPPCRRAG